MPSVACALGDVKTALNCSDLGGLLTVFWMPESKIDWTAMADPLNFDAATRTILNWIITDGTAWGEITFQRRSGRLDALYTSDNGYYEISLLNMILNGHDTARTMSLEAAVACCGIVAQVFDNNGLARMIGKEWVSGAWVDPLEKCRIGRHLDTTGGFGAADDKARDEFDLVGQQSTPPVYSEVTIQTLRAA